MDDMERDLELRLLMAEVKRLETRIEGLEADRRSFLKSGLIAVGSAAIGLLIYIWQSRFP